MPDTDVTARLRAFADFHMLPLRVAYVECPRPDRPLLQVYFASFIGQVTLQRYVARRLSCFEFQFDERYRQREPAGASILQRSLPVAGTCSDFIVSPRT